LEKGRVSIILGGEVSDYVVLLGLHWHDKLRTTIFVRILGIEIWRIFFQEIQDEVVIVAEVKLREHFLVILDR
jgi:hypothetical protein